MAYDLKPKLSELSSRYQTIVVSLNLPKKREELARFEAESMLPNLWDDQEHARSVMQKMDDLKKEIDLVGSLQSGISDLEGIIDDSDLSELINEREVALENDLNKLELKTYLSGAYDGKTAIVSIHSGQGGTEAMDWAAMLYRMYLRFCERWGFRAEVVEENRGEEAGIKNATLRVEGTYAYGYLKNEAGTHRLVRQSPFNADDLRQTSFALVEVLPEIDDVDMPEIDVKDEDCQWDFYRSGGHGGQNVNKVSTAVRLTHKPSGIIVTAQTERFQEQNRKIALSLLRAKLWKKKQEELATEKKGIKGEYHPASWGTQIRSYVLHPYKMVKDLRTNVESPNPDAVLDGEIDEFIEAELKLNAGV